VGVFARVQISDVTVSALDRFGGHSRAPYDSLNLADYVGDVDADVRRNFAEVRSMVDAQDLAIMRAEHGRRATFATADGMCDPADVIVTKTPGLALLALAADCVPIALVDPASRIVAVAHVGWRGLLAGAVDSALDAMNVAGAHVSQITAVVGPSICGSCYEVSTDVAKEITRHHPEAAVDERHVDLAKAVIERLKAQGTSVKEIAACTYENTALFSHRRAGGPTGRGGMVVMLPREGASHGEIL